MNTRTVLLILLVMIGCVSASLAQITPAALVQDLDEGKFESLQQVRATDAELILPVIRDYLIGKHDAISEPALEAIRRVPNLVQWVGQDLQKRIAPGQLDFTVHEDFELLGRLRTPESVREIGRYIDNNTILKSPSDDLGSSMVSADAAPALSLVGFKNAVTPNIWWGGIGESELREWQTWWKENQGNIDELVKEANNRPPPAPGKHLPATPQATATPQSAPLTSPPSPASLAIATATPSSVSARPTATVPPASSERRAPVWAWAIGVLAFMVIIAVAVKCRA